MTITDCALKLIEERCYYPAQLGGYSKLEAIPVDWIDQFPDYVLPTGKAASPLSLVDSNFDFINIPMSIESVKSRLDDRSSNKGHCYRNIIKGAVCGKKDEVVLTLHQYKYYCWVLRLTKFDGSVCYVGTKETPLSFTFKVSDGPKKTNAVDYDLQFEGNTKLPPILL